MREWKIAVTTVAVMVLAAGMVLAGPSTSEVKWSQPPVRLYEIDPEVTDQALIYGWDQTSMVQFPIVADDFKCNDRRPVTDIHWWGSYPNLPAGTPPRHPDAFLIRFWTDVPAGADLNPDVTWSHPGQEIWKIECRNYRVEPVGLDVNVQEWDATHEIIIQDECFQYNQDFTAAEVFRQEPGTIYWVSIQALYQDPGTEDRWGWKTRPHYFNDDAVTGIMGPTGGGIDWTPIIDLQGRSWDVAYELSVPEPATLALLGLGVAGFVARRRRSR